MEKETLRGQQKDGKELTEEENATAKMLKYMQNHKVVVFPKERKSYLQPLVIYFHQMDYLNAQSTPPHVIAAVAMMQAYFRCSNTREGYLDEKKLSREVQKVQRELYKE